MFKSTSINLFHTLQNPKLNPFHNNVLNNSYSNISSYFIPHMTAVEDGEFLFNCPIAGNPSPPMICTYSKKYNNLLGVSDEEGFLTILNTDESSVAQGLTSRTRWSAHNNAVFDLIWCNSDNYLATASGDQTCAIFDLHSQQPLATLWGHAGSVKTIRNSNHNPYIYISGARDGSVCLWDIRARGNNSSNTAMTNIPSRSIPLNAPSNSVLPQFYMRGIHSYSANKPINSYSTTKPSKFKKQSLFNPEPHQSITALTFLPDSEHLFLSGAAASATIKFWDTRKLLSKSTETQTPVTQLEQFTDRRHGISSLEVDPSGSNLLASSTDSLVYEYDLIKPHSSRVHVYTGRKAASFYIKAKYSHDGQFIATGSNEASVYIWKKQKIDFGQTELQQSGKLTNASKRQDIESNYISHRPLTVLNGHYAEVNCVDWRAKSGSPLDIELSSCSDDGTVKLWRFNEKKFEEYRELKAAIEEKRFEQRMFEATYNLQHSQQINNYAACPSTPKKKSKGPLDEAGGSGVIKTPGKTPLSIRLRPCPSPSSGGAAAAANPSVNLSRKSVVVNLQHSFAEDLNHFKQRDLHQMIKCNKTPTAAAAAAINTATKKRTISKRNAASQSNKKLKVQKIQQFFSMNNYPLISSENTEMLEDRTVIIISQ
jgi:WD40 repeat protein